jgi:NADH-quinone oxidoreductase subunit L
MQIPLIVLGILSVVGGFVELPDTLGNLPLFTNFMHTSLPALASASAGVSAELILQIIAAAVSLTGVLAAYLLFIRAPNLVSNVVRTAWGNVLHRFWFAGWGFDWVYGTFIVRPFVWLARINKNDVVDLVYQGLAWLSQALYRLLGLTQTGKVRWYAMGIAAGAVITIAIVVFL